MLRYLKVKVLSGLLQKVPGERIFGVYRFLPLFFIFGAGLEFTMIKWEVNGVNFYKTFKRKKAKEIAEWELESEIKRESSKHSYLSNSQE